MSEDVYLAAAAAGIEAGPRFVIGETFDEQLSWLAGVVALDPRFRAAIDKAVELTQEQMRKSGDSR